MCEFAISGTYIYGPPTFRKWSLNCVKFTTESDRHRHQLNWFLWSVNSMSRVGRKKDFEIVKDDEKGRPCRWFQCSFIYSNHRLNMEVHRSQKFIWAPCHVMFTAVLIGWDPATPPSPRTWTGITMALLASKVRRHLCVTPPPPPHSNCSLCARG